MVCFFQFKGDATMKTVVMEAELRAKLGGGAAKVTLIDESGNPIGHYLPDDLYRGILDALAPHEEDPRAAGLEDLERCDVMTTPELLSRMRDTLARWEGQP
jgi:hypothetical protein